MLPHTIDDQSPLSMMFMDFRSGVNRMLHQGTPLAQVLGPLDPIVDLLFRPRQATDPFSASTWACELARVHEEVDIFTQLANAFLFARLMRWLLSPTLENFMHLPEIMRPTHLQRTVPHYPSADLYALPQVRDALVRGERQLSEPVGDPTKKGLQFKWPFDLDQALDRNKVSGNTTISRLFGSCAADPTNWTCSRDFLANTMMERGILNVIEHRHGWGEAG
jgi:hypothetical protein